MSTILQTLVTILCSVIASSGFWAWFQKRAERKDIRTQLLIGLAHDRIVHLGMVFIERGNITRDEYENLYDYLYKPYKEMGGNGSAKRVMDEVARLPIRSKLVEIERSNDSADQQQNIRHPEVGGSVSPAR